MTETVVFCLVDFTEFNRLRQAITGDNSIETPASKKLCLSLNAGFLNESNPKVFDALINTTSLKKQR
ncbi:hypothetical protein, partial [Sutterella wadsworthensis]|uniref:hypothetical protein n=2 Tax=Sutterella wadsworthensis TaxID=40545 RepID=UPI0030780611